MKSYRRNTTLKIHRSFPFTIQMVETHSIQPTIHRIRRPTAGKVRTITNNSRAFQIVNIRNLQSRNEKSVANYHRNIKENLKCTTRTIRFATRNVKSLIKSDDQAPALKNRIRIHLLFWRKGRTKQMQSCNIDDISHCGVCFGIYTSKRPSLLMKLQTTHRLLNIIQVQRPTSKKPDEDVEIFNSNIEDQMRTNKRGEITRIMGNQR